MMKDLVSKIYDQVDYPEIERLKKLVNERRIPLRLTGVTSRNLVAWKKKDLFDYPDKLRVQLNFKEFLWIKIIQSMRKFGISLNVIQRIKKTLDIELDIQEGLEKHKAKVLKGMMAKLEEENYSAEDLQKIASALDNGGIEDLFKSQSFGHTLMDLLISVMITSRTRVGVLLLEDQTCIPWMDHFFDINDKSKAMWQGNHLFISFNKYFTDFLTDEGIDEYLLPYEILSPDEKEILGYIRMKQYKSIEIKFNDDRKPELLRLTQTISHDARIIDVLSRNDYANIVITQKDGNVKNITSHITKKLNKGKNPN